MQASAAIVMGPQQKDATQQVNRLAQSHMPTAYMLPPSRDLDYKLTSKWTCEVDIVRTNQRHLVHVYNKPIQSAVLALPVNAWVHTWVANLYRNASSQTVSQYKLCSHSWHENISYICLFLQPLTELREKYEDLQRNVEYIKAHLKLSTADMCAADGATSGGTQYPSTRPTSARIWVFGGHDGSDWMSDSRIFHIQKWVLAVFVS